MAKPKATIGCRDHIWQLITENKAVQQYTKVDFSWVG